MLREHVDRVAANCHSAWSAEEFLAHNKHAWSQLHEELRERNVEQAEQLLSRPINLGSAHQISEALYVSLSLPKPAGGALEPLDIL